MNGFTFIVKAKGFRKSTLTCMVSRTHSLLYSSSAVTPLRQPIISSVASSSSSSDQRQRQQPPTELTDQLFSILVSSPKWYEDPLLKILLPFVSPSTVSSLLTQNLHPRIALQFFDLLARRRGFEHDVRSHSSLLNVLIPNGLFLAAERIFVSMLNRCDSAEDARSALEALRAHSELKLSVSCYNMLLALLSRFSMVDEMRLVVLGMLSDGGVSPDLVTLNSMIKACFEIGDVAEASMYLCRVLTLGFDPDSVTYSLMIECHCRKNDFDSARKVFDKMRFEGIVAPEVYETLVVGLCNAGRFEEASGLFSEMDVNKCSATVPTYNALISASCGVDRKEKALGLFRRMKETGLEPNVDTYTVLVEILCRDAEFVEAFDMLSEMVEKGLVPSVETFNTLIRGYCTTGLVETVHRVLQLMELTDALPNARTFDILIQGCSVENLAHKAMNLFHEMVDRNLSPSLATYNCLIRTTCEVGHLESALALLKSMNENGLIGDPSSYSVLIKSLAKNNDLKGASEIFESLRSKGVERTETMYRSLINGYCSVGRTEKALALFEEMNRTLDFCPSVHTYSAIINGLGKDEKLKEASSMLARMFDSHVEPCLVTFRILVKEAVKRGEFEKALEILDQTSFGCLKPDVSVYNLFISSYCNIDQIEKAEDMIVKMRREGVSPNSTTYSLLVDTYGRLGLIDTAFGTLKRAFESGSDPSHDTYFSLIKHLANRNGDDISKTMEFEDALKLFKRMNEHDCSPTTSTYEKLVVQLCNEKRFQVAESLFSHMKGENVSPSEGIYKALFACCCELGYFEEAIEFLESMISGRYLPPLEHSKVLVCGLCEEENREKATAVFRDLIGCEYGNFDEVAWKLLVDGLLERDHVDTCFEFLCIMELMGCEIQPETYSILLDGIDRRYWNILKDSI